VSTIYFIEKLYYLPSLAIFCYVCYSPTFLGDLVVDEERKTNLRRNVVNELMHHHLFIGGGKANAILTC